MLHTIKHNTSFLFYNALSNQSYTTWLISFNDDRRMIYIQAVVFLYHFEITEK